jgi:hypothetical protein
MDELFDPQSSPFEISNLKSEIPIPIYSSDFSAFFLDAFLVAGFSAASVTSAFGATFFARGAAAAPPRFRPLLSASFAGFEGIVGPALLLAFGSGLASLLREIVM